MNRTSSYEKETLSQGNPNVNAVKTRRIVTAVSRFSFYLDFVLAENA